MTDSVSLKPGLVSIALYTTEYNDKATQDPPRFWSAPLFYAVLAVHDISDRIQRGLVWEEAMTTQGLIADADGDIAALVYSAGDRPDLVLCAFAEHLAATGKRLCGLVQFRDGLRDGSPGRVMVLDSRQIVEVGCKRDPAANDQCRL